MRYYISWSLHAIGTPNPTFANTDFKNNAIARMRQKYPSATKIDVPLNSTTHHWRAYSTAYAGTVYNTELKRYDVVYYNYAKIDRPYEIDIGGAVGISRTIELYFPVLIIYSVRITTNHTKSSVDLNSILQEGLQSNINFVDIQIQNGYFARFTCSNGSTVNNTSYTFVGLYSAGGYFIIKPQINIKITDNLSIIQLSNGSYLLGIYKKGLYWIKKDGNIQSMVSSNLYNFRLNYKRREI